MTTKQQLLITFIPPAFILVAIAGVSVFFQVRMPAMTQDVTFLGRLHPLAGVLSSLGIILWSATASICYFAAATLRNTKQGGVFWFLLCSALLSSYLLFDDFFRIHEALSRVYLGVSAKAVYAAIGVAVFTYLIAFRRLILQTRFIVLLLAIGFLSSSVVMDVIHNPWLMPLGDWQFFFEDGAKWLGIASWCSYYAHTSHSLLVSFFDRLGDAT